ncbi:hypothetical protein Taro_034363 [Colocasia esculenta]|uniref:Uncharacterized protein n=1 Tax=Colocasia esculenta TaxID=4460 RepID=A0A843W2Q8_COLES|nr:hypothetical protein [Colocasia esculenta]
MHAYTHTPTFRGLKATTRVIKRGKLPLWRPAVFIEEERTHIIPHAISPLKGFELPHPVQSGCCCPYHHLSASTICIPLDHTKDLVALRNLGFEFPSIKNNDYLRGSLAAWIGRYAWHVRTTDPCIHPRLDSPA